MDQLFYDVLGALGFSHPIHPVLITMVVGPVIASFLFAAVALVFRKPQFYRTSRQLTVVGFIFWFPTVAVGIIDWTYFYGASLNMPEINTKLVLAGILFLVLLGNILLFRKGEDRPVPTIALTLAGTILVSALGFFGGEIVFGSKPAPRSTQSATTSDAEGFKELHHEGYTVAWKIRGKTIDVKLSYATSGWVGIGFGKTGTMEGSHIIIGFVLDGEATVADHFGYARDKHGPQEKAGGKDSLTARGGTLAEGTTTITFSMPLNTGNPKDPVLVEGETYKVILANGGDDMTDIESYHGRSGRTVVDLKL